MKFGFSGFDRFRRFFDGKRRREALAKESRKKLRQQLQLVRRDVINYIDSETHGVPNSPLTILAKGSSRPLVDHGDLRSSASVQTFVRRGEVSGGVGVLRSARTRDGKSLSNVATALHEGFVVRVTPKVRAAVFAQMRKRGRTTSVRSTGGSGATSWKVRGRPFVRVPFEAAIPRIKEALGDAVVTSFRRD